MTTEEMTPDQKILAKKALLTYRSAQVFSSIRFAVELFGANLLGLVVGVLVMGDTDPEMHTYYAICLCVLNCVLMNRRLNARTKRNNEALTVEFKKIQALTAEA